MTCGNEASTLSNVVSIALERMCANLHGNISDTSTLPLSVCRFLQRYRVSNRNLRDIFNAYIKQIISHDDFHGLEPLALRHSACRFFDLGGTDGFESFLKSVPKDFRCPRPVSASKRLESRWGGSGLDGVACCAIVIAVPSSPSKLSCAPSRLSRSGRARLAT